MSQVGGVPYGASKPWQATNYLSYFLEGTELDEVQMAALVQGVQGAKASHSGFMSYSYLLGALDYHFPQRDVGYPVEAVRTQLRGRCSSFQPWASTFQSLMDELSAGFGCGVATSEFELWGVTLEPGFGGWRHQMGFFPHLTGPTEPGRHVAGGGFTMFGNLEADLTDYVQNADGFFNVAYEFQVENHRPRLVVAHGKVRATGSYANENIQESLSEAIGTKLPAAFTATMQSRLSQLLPGKIVFPSKAVCPAACSLGAPDLEDCRTRTTDTLKTILITHLTKQGLSDTEAKTRAARMVEDFKPSDFSCESAFEKTGGGVTPDEAEEYNFQMCSQAPCAGGSACGVCTFHVPVQAVNVYNDGFELVMREAENDTLAALQRALLESNDAASAAARAELDALCNPSDGERDAFTRDYTFTHVHDHACFDHCPGPGAPPPPALFCKP